MACQNPHQQSRRGTGIAQIKHSRRLDQAANTPAINLPNIILLLDLSAQLLHRSGGRQHVLALKQAGDGG